MQTPLSCFPPHRRLCLSCAACSRPLQQHSMAALRISSRNRSIASQRSAFLSLSAFRVAALARSRVLSPPPRFLSSCLCFLSRAAISPPLPLLVPVACTCLRLVCLLPLWMCCCISRRAGLSCAACSRPLQQHSMAALRISSRKRRSAASRRVFRSNMPCRTHETVMPLASSDARCAPCLMSRREPASSSLISYGTAVSRTCAS